MLPAIIQLKLTHPQTRQATVSPQQGKEQQRPGSPGVFHEGVRQGCAAVLGSFWPKNSGIGIYFYWKNSVIGVSFHLEFSGIGVYCYTKNSGYGC